MTEEERILKRQLKEQVVMWLRNDSDGLMQKWHAAIDDTDPLIWQYTCMVTEHPDDHNLYELLAVKRFFLMLDRHDWNPGE